jgi:hypothetical protein
MLEFLNSAADVIAVRISGKLTEPELAELVERVETSVTARDQTHMFMEVEDFTGFDLGAFARYLPRGTAMLGKLGRFGRIAVVSDQPWIRAWTRTESALLPGISYELYWPDQREQALAWVEGRRDQPHSPAITIIDTDTPGVLGFQLDGTVGADELPAAVAYFEEAMERERPVRILGRIKHVGGIEPKALLSPDYLAMKLRALRKVERYALVGGPAWLRAWIGLIDPVVKMELRHFAAEDEALAWSWLGAQPKAERPLAA